MAEINVIVEVSVPRTAPAGAAVQFLGAEMSAVGFRIDPTYQPVEYRSLRPPCRRSWTPRTKRQW